MPRKLSCAKFYHLMQGFNCNCNCAKVNKTLCFINSISFSHELQYFTPNISCYHDTYFILVFMFVSVVALSLSSRVNISESSLSSPQTCPTTRIVEDAEEKVVERLQVSTARLQVIDPPISGRHFLTPLYRSTTTIHRLLPAQATTQTTATCLHPVTSRSTLLYHCHNLHPL